MPILDEQFLVRATDPRCPEATELMRRLTIELAARYQEDCSGNFVPEDVLVPGSGFVLGWLGNRPVACGAFRPLGPGIAEIKRMYVEPEWRNRGFGRRLLADLEGRARQARYARIWLETGVLQPEAIHMYEAVGYRQIERYGIYEDNVHSVCFEKVL